VKGSYILLIELAAEENVLIGKLGYVLFPKAFYAYVGSAMNGLEARLARHLRKEKELHWHIDYLLKEAKLLEIILCPGEQRIECSLARELAKEFQSIPGFGSSDCKCQSHLYFTNEKDRLKAKVTETINKANIAYKILPERKS
jgi:Uri superfamily endonuclease